ncbi:MAG TPA: alpha-amylase/4-alpha-glucanotransferase domain-containing protein, partial [Bacteroidota bacterium]
MKTINLVIGIHNHQPIGNFDHVFSHAHDHSYKPFLDVLERYPKVRIAQHYTGILLDWLKSNKPGLLQQVRRLVKSGQVEIMGGAYYEAILSVIPDEDKMSQLDRLRKAVKKEFGTEPTGMWLAERVWEQHLTRFIADAGLQYIVIDDTHFKYAGFCDEELHGYYVTEEQGRTVCIFPISKVLRYTVPFQPVQKTIDYLRSIATEDGTRVAVFADDGEKFGVWPKTYDHVYKAGWLDEFFRALSENSDWIKILQFHEAVETIKPVGRTYLPNASYAEMMHWALPTHHVTLYEEFEHYLKDNGVLEKYESFFKGGFWRNFLAKYSETNNMHKKMMRVSSEARRLQAEGKKVPAGTMEKIWASQCNDAYWHGVFGGMYLPVLRYPVYHNLISAEADMDRIRKKKTASVDVCDFDCDGKHEVLVETPMLDCYVKPDEGGKVFELDFKPISLNLLDIVSRREEGYHRKLLQNSQKKNGDGQVTSIHDIVSMKEEGLEKHLHYDWYRRGSLIDHFLGSGTTLEALWQCQYPEEGDFVNQPYVAHVGRSGGASVQLVRNGAIWRDGKPHKLRVQKTLHIDAGNAQIQTKYKIHNSEQTPVSLWFGVEFNVGLQAGDAADRYYYIPGRALDDARLRSKGEITDAAVVGLRDEWLG